MIRRGTQIRFASMLVTKLCLQENMPHTVSSPTVTFMTVHCPQSRQTFQTPWKEIIGCLVLGASPIPVSPIWCTDIWALYQSPHLPWNVGC